MNYDEWEATQDFSPASPEAHYAERAWNAAVSELRRLVKAAGEAESTIAGVVMLLDEELTAMESNR